MSAPSGDRILIHDLVARGVVGVNDWEREQPQEIVVNIALGVDPRPAGASDVLEATVNYRTVAKRVLAHVETAARYTVEALAEDIALMCLEDERVNEVWVRVEKPGAVRFARSVGVEITRRR